MGFLKERKNIIIGSILLILIIVISLAIGSSTNANKNDSTKRVEYNVDGLIQIDLDEFNEKVNDKENNIFFISNSQSSFDGEFAQSLKEAQNELKCKIYVIDIIDIDSNDESYKDYENIIAKATKTYNKNSNVSLDTLSGTTPLLIISNDGEILDTLLGGQEYSNIKKFIEKNL